MDFRAVRGFFSKKYSGPASGLWRKAEEKWMKNDLNKPEYYKLGIELVEVQLQCWVEVGVNSPCWNAGCTQAIFGFQP